MDEIEIAQLFEVLEDPPNPMSAAELLAAAKRRRAPRAAWGVAALVVLGLGLAWRAGPAPEGLAPRGLEEVRATVQLRWAVEGAQLRRGDAAGVAGGERVIFQARSEQTGYLCLDEQGASGAWTRVHPTQGAAWRAEVGDNPVLDGTAPQAWRPDDGSGPRRYRLSFDPTSADCADPTATDEAEVLWLP